jgi:hypothetical protein
MSSSGKFGKQERERGGRTGAPAGLIFAGNDTAFNSTGNAADQTVVWIDGGQGWSAD